MGKINKLIQFLQNNFWKYIIIEYALPEIQNVLDAVWGLHDRITFKHFITENY